MSDEKKRPAPWATLHTVLVPLYEEGEPGNSDLVLYAPPERVLEVSVVDDYVFLRVAKYEQISRSSSLEGGDDFVVPAEGLLRALRAQMP